MSCNENKLGRFLTGNGFAKNTNMQVPYFSALIKFLPAANLFCCISSWNLFLQINFGGDFWEYCFLILIMQSRWTYYGIVFFIESVGLCSFQVMSCMQKQTKVLKNAAKSQNTKWLTKTIFLRKCIFFIF